MSHLVKIQQIIDGILAIENKAFESFESAKTYIEDKADAFIRIFNDNGELVHTIGGESEEAIKETITDTKVKEDEPLVTEPVIVNTPVTVDTTVIEPTVETITEPPTEKQV